MCGWSMGGCLCVCVGRREVCVGGGVAIRCFTSRRMGPPAKRVCGGMGEGVFVCVWVGGRCVWVGGMGGVCVCVWVGGRCVWVVVLPYDVFYLTKDGASSKVCVWGYGGGCGGMGEGVFVCVWVGGRCVWVGGMGVCVCVSVCRREVCVGGGVAVRCVLPHEGWGLQQGVCVGGLGEGVFVCVWIGGRCVWVGGQGFIQGSLRID